MKSLVKQPSESLKRNIPFDDAGAIAAIVSVAAISRGQVAGSAALGVVGSLTGGMLFVELSGGTDGELYLVTARVTSAAGEQLEGELEVAVIDGKWTMPDGGDGWVTIAEFVRRFGLEETVRMTDGGDGRIDREMLVRELRAAQSVAEVYVAAAYALPLATVPDILKVQVADLARARLYPRGAPEGVAEAAKAATKMLERISERKLPLPAATPVQEAPSSAPIMISPGQRQYPPGLPDY